MAYTSFEKIREINRTRFGTDCGPFQPKLYNSGKGNDLKTAALAFIHDGCEELRFSDTDVEEEIASGKLSGKGLKPNQVPYNMQMDTDRLCLEKSLEHFIDSGVKEDAYDVYYCYMEMFLGSYCSSKSMVELLSEFESNGSSLLMKHRDHYSHSVYVFALGLAIYQSNRKYRDEFKKFYGFSTDENNKDESLKANHAYLKLWGLTSLFHDIGYPFELPFEQVMSYFEIDKEKRVPGIPYISYNSLERLTDFNDTEKEHFSKLYGRDFDSISHLLSADICSKMSDFYGLDEQNLTAKISAKPFHPENYNYFMDHAFFSSARLYKQLVQTMGAENITKEYVDALSAILLHNSIFKFLIISFKSKDPAKRKAPLPMNLHPLAYMLMLCDELQCWDRTSYGRDTRNQLHPMSADFELGDSIIKVKYHYDISQQHKIDSYNKKLKDFEDNLTDKKPKLKAYSEMTGRNTFVSEIKDIVDLDGIEFTAVPDTVEPDRSKKHTYLSSSSFLHLYDFAVILFSRRTVNSIDEDLNVEKLYPAFDSLSLEYRISHLDRAKHFDEYLNKIGCFYTDKPVDFTLLSKFTERQLDKIAPMEHERWLAIHEDYGWVYDNIYEKCILDGTEEEIKEQRKILREQIRCHKLMVRGKVTHKKAVRHYYMLPDAEKDKDIEPMNYMLKLICRMDGVKIYSIN